jgi:putative ABC transport system ATP-binding protein
MTKTLLRLSKIERSYTIGNTLYPILKGINLEFLQGEFIAIMGPSGSGKSTLLNIIGCLDKPSSGTYTLEDKDVSMLSGRQLADIRNRHIGFIFQNFNLIPSLNALENVLLPAFYMNNEDEQRAKQLLFDVGLSDRMSNKPNELSGGQKQRVAIARALMNDPNLILADEPTGALDSHTGQEIMKLILDLNQKSQKTIVMVTHDINIAKMAHRIVNIHDGVVKK